MTIFIISIGIAALIGLSVWFGMTIERGWKEFADEHENVEDARG